MRRRDRMVENLVVLAAALVMIVLAATVQP